MGRKPPVAAELWSGGFTVGYADGSYPGFVVLLFPTEFPDV